MRGLTTALFTLLLASSARAEAYNEEPTHTTHAPACTATSSSGSGAYFDLRPDIAWPDDSGKSHKSSLHKDYHSRGYDYGKNFTLNICNPVIDPVTEVQGVEENLWANVSAYYTSHGKTYSIGSESLDLHSRGRKLFLQYTGGSPCGGSTSENKERDGEPYMDADVFKTKQNHEIETFDNEQGDGTRRKSTIISFLCDRDPSKDQPMVSFVATDPDECVYFFEARTVHACPAAEPHKPGSVGPGSVFGLILLIAVLVYFLGGVFYNRTVNHARGWRQLPNYSLWAGMWSFICDMFIIATASCARMFPSRRGYSSLTTTRESDQEAQQNALIDQLDEEWDD